MKTTEFVDIINKIVREASVADALSSLRTPPGRQPSPALVALSTWYKGLDATDQAMVERLMDMVARDTVFGLLAVLDGVRQVEGRGPKGHFELRYVKEGRTDLLNDPSGEMLHELLE